MEELYKEDFHDPDNHSGVITHLEADILECEVKSSFAFTLIFSLVPFSVPAFHPVPVFHLPGSQQGQA